MVTTRVGGTASARDRRAEGAAEKSVRIDTGDQVFNVILRPGKSSRTPLLALNGIGSPAIVLQPFVDALDPDIPVVRIDAPGVGGSPVSKCPYTMFGLAARIGKVLDELGHPQVDVLGFSWGGGLAQQIAVTENRRLRQLVLVATAPGWWMVPASPNVLRHMGSSRRHADLLHLQRIANTLYGGTVRQNPEVLRLIRRADDPTNQADREVGYRHQLMALATVPPAPALRLVRQPTLILAGDDDPLIPLINSLTLKLMLRDSQRVVYRGGHIELVANPDPLAAVIADFLNDGGADSKPASDS